MQVSIGIDEAGLGPIAGPVVVSVVAIPEGADMRGVTDSKKIRPEKREFLVSKIHDEAVYYRTILSMAPTIDRHGPSHIWTEMVRELAVEAHALYPDAEIILDGNRVVGLPYVRPEVKADSRFRSVAAASILSKVRQCRWMDRYHLEYPQYGFDQHRGYCTKFHLERLEAHGPCPVHRMTFGPVKKAAKLRSV